MNSTTAFDQPIRPALKSDIVPWLPTILSSIAIVMVPVAFFAFLFAAFSAWGDGEMDGAFMVVFFGAAATWAALLLGAVVTMTIALGRGNRITLIGLMPMAIAASPLCIFLA